MAHNSIALPVSPRHTGKRIPMHVIRALVRQIAEIFAPNQIILFGSHAYGEPKAWSDVDSQAAKAALAATKRVRAFVRGKHGLTE